MPPEKSLPLKRGVTLNRGIQIKSPALKRGSPRRTRRNNGGPAMSRADYLKATERDLLAHYSRDLLAFPGLDPSIAARIRAALEVPAPRQPRGTPEPDRQAPDFPAPRRPSLDVIIRREGDQHRDRLRLMRADHAVRRHAATRCDGTCE